MKAEALTRSSQRLTSINRGPGGAVRVRRTDSVCGPMISSTADRGSFFRGRGVPTMARTAVRIIAPAAMRRETRNASGDTTVLGLPVPSGHTRDAAE